MQPLDQRSTLQRLYKVGARTPELVDVPALTVIAIDGVGDPATSAEYQASVEALMAMAWGIRAYRKSSQLIKVMPLEGVWTLPGIESLGRPGKIRAQLQWSLQIVQPEDLSADEVEVVRQSVRKKKTALSHVSDVRLESIPGGPAATMLHIGPFSDEPATIARIHEEIVASGGEPIRGHREVYLSDLRRTPSEKLKTILRVGIRP